VTGVCIHLLIGLSTLLTFILQASTIDSFVRVSAVDIMNIHDVYGFS